MTKKQFTKLAKKHLTIDEKQNLAFGRKFKYIGGIEELYKAMNFTHCCKSDSEQLPKRKRECTCSGMSDKVKCDFKCYD